MNAFSKTGAMHILSVSGLHVGMVAVPVRILGKVPLSGRWGQALRSEPSSRAFGVCHSLRGRRIGDPGGGDV
ncbi:MAG: ComEC/Rec2 family competence protein [Haliscomenobacter sp.]|nr:ComEC/Rec2 family competence protein [Haliscomenobacter sp.]